MNLNDLSWKQVALFSSLVAAPIVAYAFAPASAVAVIGLVTTIIGWYSNQNKPVVRDSDPDSFEPIPITLADPSVKRNTVPDLKIIAGGGK